MWACIGFSLIDVRDSGCHVYITAYVVGCQSPCLIYFWCSILWCPNCLGSDQLLCFIINKWLHFSGIQGRPVELFSNHVQLRSCSQRNLYKYNVIYTPGIEDGRKREALLSELEKLLGKCHIYDGNYLLLPHPLGEMVKYYYSTFCWHCSFSPIFTLPFSICYSQTHTVPVKQTVEISCMPLTHMTYNKITCHVWLSLIL